MITEFANFKKYDKKGRRISVFGKLNGDKIDICVHTCSKADQFSREKAYIVHKEWEISRKGKPIIAETPVIDNKPMKSFLEFCDKEFYEYDEWPVQNAVIPVVYKENPGGEGEVKIVGKVKAAKY